MNNQTVPLINENITDVEYELLNRRLGASPNKAIAYIMGDKDDETKMPWDELIYEDIIVIM